MLRREMDANEALGKGFSFLNDQGMIDGEEMPDADMTDCSPQTNPPPARTQLPFRILSPSCGVWVRNVKRG